MLLGCYVSSLGAKRRCAVPTVFRQSLGEKFIIAKWYESCLVLVSFDFWQKLLDRLTGGSRVVSLGVRGIERFILGSAFEIIPDAQGRIIIPEILAEYASLTGELVFVGLGDRVEIWPKVTWDKKSSELAQVTKEYIESISGFENKKDGEND